MNRRIPHPKCSLLGLAFDAEDGQKRITRGPNFFLAGGTQETHGIMQETAIKVNEHLDGKGKRLEDVSLFTNCGTLWKTSRLNSPREILSFRL